jgi:hypothetical protein
LSDSGRFAHHPDHLLDVAREAGLRIISQATEVLRYEYGEAVVGLVTVMGTRDEAEQFVGQMMETCEADHFRRVTEVGERIG